MSSASKGCSIYIFSMIDIFVCRCAQTFDHIKITSEQQRHRCQSIYWWIDREREREFHIKYIMMPNYKTTARDNSFDVHRINQSYIISQLIYTYDFTNAYWHLWLWCVLSYLRVTGALLSISLFVCLNHSMSHHVIQRTHISRIQSESRSLFWKQFSKNWFDTFHSNAEMKRQNICYFCLLSRCCRCFAKVT